MNKIKVLIYILILSFTVTEKGLSQNNDNDAVTKSIYIDHEKSRIEILGKTNVNHFKCNFNVRTLEEKNTVHLRAQSNQQQVVGGKIQLKLDAFNCDNAQMTNDFKNLLKYKTHPYITVQVNKITNVSQNKYAVETSIQLAGEEQSYTMNLSSSSKNGLIECLGKQEICISDFGLVAPEKFFGMVKVNENISINFYLVLEIN